MSREQYKNLAKSTAAGAIDSSTDPVTFSVASGEGALFPATTNGPFRIVIDSEVLKVTSRSTDSFTAARAQEGSSIASHSSGASVIHSLTTGAMDAIRGEVNQVGLYSALPSAGTCKAGDHYKCSDSEYEFYHNGSAWLAFYRGIPVTMPPAASGYTQENSGRGTLTDNAGGGLLLVGSESSPINWEPFSRSVPSAPYTYEIGCTTTGVMSTAASDNGIVGLFLSDGTKYKWWALADVLSVMYNTARETFNSTLKNTTGGWHGASQVAGPLFVRIRDDNTTLFYDWSKDGQNWRNYYSESRTNLFTATKIGFMVRSGPNAQMQKHVFHLKVA